MARQRIRQARDRVARERIARGGLGPVDPSTMIARAVEAEEDGYPEIGESFRRMAAAVEELYALGLSAEQADDVVYGWLFRRTDE